MKQSISCTRDAKEGEIETIGVLRVAESHLLQSECDATVLAAIALVRDQISGLTARARTVRALSAREDQVLFANDYDVVAGTLQDARVVHAQVQRVLFACVADLDRLCHWDGCRTACEQSRDRWRRES